MYQTNVPLLNLLNPFRGSAGGGSCSTYITRSLGKDFILDLSRGLGPELLTHAWSSLVSSLRIKEWRNISCKRLADQLHEIGRNVDDEELTAYVLAGLPRENMLVNQEKRLRQYYPVPQLAPATALHVQTYPNKGGRGYQNGGCSSQGGCSNQGGGCGTGRSNSYGGGHDQSQWKNDAGYNPGHGSGGWERQGYRRGSSQVVYGRVQSPYAPVLVRLSGNFSSTQDVILGQGPSTVICQICNSVGHSALQCSEYFNQNQSQHVRKSLATLTLNDHPSANAYLDSGASSHMANSKGQSAREDPTQLPF
ncbi:hypothetical protein CRG98_025947 [Punica granatum]|uniref:Uncharacterized protein n=1 Tax=Punica granatum TaxID=22663 RepID=A0A2I0JDH4_PUNGR|nr:hypothetical protein CRG98_025947 [Punica granatum]